MKRLLGLLLLLPACAWTMDHDPWHAYSRLEFSANDQGRRDFVGNGWIGGDDQRLWWQVQASGEADRINESSLALWYGRYVAPFWDAQIGLRSDLKPEQSNYLSLGVRGLAPYQFDTDVKFELGSNGRALLHGHIEQELLLSNYLILTPWLHASLSAAEVDATVRPGLYQTAIGAQLRYEFSRKFAPYLELSRTVHPQATETVGETQLMLGLRLLF